MNFVSLLVTFDIAVGLWIRRVLPYSWPHLTLGWINLFVGTQILVSSTHPSHFPYFTKYFFLWTTWSIYAMVPPTSKSSICYTISILSNLWSKPPIFYKLSTFCILGIPFTAATIFTTSITPYCLHSTHYLLHALYTLLSIHPQCSAIQNLHNSAFYILSTVSTVSILSTHTHHCSQFEQCLLNAPRTSFKGPRLGGQSIVSLIRGDNKPTV